MAYLMEQGFFAAQGLQGWACVAAHGLQGCAGRFLAFFSCFFSCFPAHGLHG
ncbi:MAG: hypothetical protein L0191_18810 [Acidobacteria bacterium]|nr:hypothetical protein [Acidobacteriota bacterium]